MGDSWWWAYFSSPFYAVAWRRIPPDLNYLTFSLPFLSIPCSGMANGVFTNWIGMQRKHCGIQQWTKSPSYEVICYAIPSFGHRWHGHCLAVGVKYRMRRPDLGRSECSRWKRRALSELYRLTNSLSWPCIRVAGISRMALRAGDVSIPLTSMSRIRPLLHRILHASG